jgi:hypothetical protein
MSAQRRVVIFFVSFNFVLLFIRAGVLMPRIEQLRNKIKNISESLPQMNIKNLFESARIECDENGNTHKIISLEHKQEDLEILNNELKNLYWGNRIELAEHVKVGSLANKEEHRQLLANELMKRYKGENCVNFKFIHDLVSEEANLNDLTTRILKAISESKKSPREKQLNELLSTAAKIRINLQTITAFANEILMN